MTTTVAPATRPTTAKPSTPERRWLIPACAGVVMVLYALSATMFARDGTGTDFHRRQAAALAAGHLDIRPVPAALADMDDPYDAEQNLDVRLNGGVQDLAYRDGRLYSAHGLTIPLLLVPTELLAGAAPPNWAITLAGACTTVAAGAWALAQVRRRFVPALPDWAAASTVVAFGLCGPLWIITSVGNGYEAAIVVSAALSTLGGALLLKSTAGRSAPLGRRGLSRVHAALGSALLAVAVGARPTAVVNVVIVCVVAWVVTRSDVAGRAGAHDIDDRSPIDLDQHRRSRRWGDLVAVVAPYVVIGTLVGLSNLVRFGSISEFGFGYQLSVWNMTEYPKGRPGYLVANMVDQLLAVPGLHRSFPWISLRPTIGGDRPTMHTSEPIVGLLFTTPALMVGAFCAVTRGATLWQRCRSLAVVALTAAATGTLGLIATSVPFNTSSLRYVVDGAPMLTLAACATWMWARTAASDRDVSNPVPTICSGVDTISDTDTETDIGEATGVAHARQLDLAWLVAVVAGVIVTAAVQVST